LFKINHKFYSSKAANPWNKVYYEFIDQITLDNDILHEIMVKFYKNIVYKLQDDQAVSFLIKFQLYDNTFKTLNKQIIADNKSFKLTMEEIYENCFRFNEYYKQMPLQKALINYRIVKKDNKNIKNIKKEIIKHINYMAINKITLPLSINIEDYGTIQNSIDNTNIINFKDNNKYILYVKIETDMNFYRLIRIKDNKLTLEWIDFKLNDNYFHRRIGNTLYHIKNGKMTNIETIKKSSPITTLKQESKLDNYFITMDIETILINNIHTPYLISFYNGEKSESFFIDNINSVTNAKVINEKIFQMFTNCFNKLIDYKQNNKNLVVYFHNFAKFDSYFILKYLVKLGKVKPIIKDGNIISINFKYKYKNKTVTIVFKDSYLLLLASLRDLCKSFNVKTHKSIFPYLFNDINYNGEVPDFKYFSNITLSQYIIYFWSFIGKHWSFKDEAIKYCIIDCISLHEILTKFSILFFNKFKLNIKNALTLPSLAFKTWRTNYLIETNPEYMIHNISGLVDDFIRSGYTGGAVDMYIPENLGNELIYEYDINSLYPSQMKDKVMPCGSPKFKNVNININSIEDLSKIITLFGFFKAKIIAPTNLKYPIIQTHVKTKQGVRTVAPLGTWTDILFSEEIKNAVLYGYKFEIYYGYSFNPVKIFENYINDLYNLRLKYPKSDPMNYVAKILLNSLYGRFGMNENFTILEIMSNEEFINFNKKNADKITDFTELDNYYLVELENYRIFEDNLDIPLNNINVAVAAGITSYSRMVMSQFKNNPLFKLFYTDTDSIFTNMLLNPSLVSDTILGKMKLERICSEAIFLAPKVYGLLDIDGNQIIKIKGLSKDNLSSLNLSDLDRLLVKNSKLEFNQSKWYRNISSANINIKDQLYTLKVTNNKRKLLYNNNDLLTGTTPFIINDKKEIVY
jgi:hypothetical protein